MEIEITKTTKTKHIIDITFPYYYRHDLSSYEDYRTNIIYGKIMEYREYIIQVTIDHDKKEYEFGEDSRSDCYFEPKYKSTKEQYENVKKRAMEFINKF